MSNEIFFQIVRHTNEENIFYKNTTYIFLPFNPCYEPKNLTRKPLIIDTHHLLGGAVVGQTTHPDDHLGTA